MFLYLNHRDGFPSVMYWVFLCSSNSHKNQYSNSIQWARRNFAAAHPQKDVLWNQMGLVAMQSFHCGPREGSVMDTRVSCRILARLGQSSRCLWHINICHSYYIQHACHISISVTHTPYLDTSTSVTYTKYLWHINICHSCGTPVTHQHVEPILNACHTSTSVTCTTFIPKLLLRLLWFFQRTAALFRQIRTFPQLFRFYSDLWNSAIRQIVRRISGGDFKQPQLENSLWSFCCIKSWMLSCVSGLSLLL